MLPAPAPSRTDQVTSADCPPETPVTVALKETTPPAMTEAVDGEIETATAGASVTLTVAIEAFDGSATLVATT